MDSWEAVAKYLAEVIQEAATDGFDSADIIMSFDNSGWWLHSTENEDGGEGINPLIIKTELSKMGYKTTVFKHNFDKQRIYFDLTPVTDDDLRSLKITECSTEEDEAEETYTLRVSWLP